MTVYGMNRWKSAKASEFTTGEGSEQVRTTGEDGGGPIKKPEDDGQMPEADTTAMAMSPLMRPQSGDADGPIKKSLRVRGSERLQAVRPDENTGPNQNGQNGQRDECVPSRPGRPRRRRRRRTTRGLGRSSSTP